MIGRMKAAVSVLALAWALGLAGCGLVAQAPDIAAGYNAKRMCSEVFVAERPEADVRKNDLKGWHPEDCKVDLENQTVTDTFGGLTSRTAVFRPGLGCTLLEKLTPGELRKAGMKNPPPKQTPSPSRVLTSTPTVTGCPAYDPAKLKAAVDRAFIEPGRCDLITRAVVVVHRDRVICEKYRDREMLNKYGEPGEKPFSADTPIHGWSMTKSVLNALVGILVKKGLLAEDQTCLMPQWSGENDTRRDITLKEMLQMNSGLDFWEWYFPSDDVTTMLFTKGDMAGFAAEKPLIYFDSRPWSYSSGTANMLSRLVRRALGDDQQRYYEFPRKELFDPLGMTNVFLEPDEAGTYVVSSYMYATARDWARFGALYLNDGVWNGRRILDSQWIKDSVTPVAVDRKGRYGYQWWLNHGLGDRGANRRWASLPNDIFSAEGHNGQIVAVIPSRCLVVVRLGLSDTGCFQHEDFLADILAAFEKPRAKH